MPVLVAFNDKRTHKTHVFNLTQLVTETVKYPASRCIDQSERQSYVLVDTNEVQGIASEVIGIGRL